MNKKPRYWSSSPCHENSFAVSIKFIDEMTMVPPWPTTGPISKIKFALNGFYAGLSAGFIGIAPRRSRHSNCADQGATGLNDQSATNNYRAR